jgi:tRNA-Thr(GGU) m(6)t(6)A37 methyltransferase TsaA
MYDRYRAGQGYEVVPVGYVESSLVDLADAPSQGDEGAPSAWLVFVPEVADAMGSLKVGDRIVVLTWLDRARRNVLRTYPRGDRHSPHLGVFSLRSPDRPNPIGLHPVEVLQVSGRRVLVSNLEAVDGTPVLDVKPVIGLADC